MQEETCTTNFITEVNQLLINSVHITAGPAMASDMKLLTQLIIELQRIVF